MEVWFRSFSFLSKWVICRGSSRYSSRVYDFKFFRNLDSFQLTGSQSLKIYPDPYDSQIQVSEVDRCQASNTGDSVGVIEDFRGVSTA